MNEKGLCFDGFATAYNPVYNPDGKPGYNGNILYKIMEECETVEEAVTEFTSYYFPWMSQAQFLFADQTGASVIIEGDSVIYNEHTYQVLTNFYHTNTQLGGWPCWRYNTAVSMLENMQDLSIDYFRSILDATHQDGLYPTQYSNIFDLSQGKIYLYHFHDFDHVVEFDLAEELESGARTVSLHSLFRNAVDSEFVKPIFFDIHPNFPNPFNSMTNIRFDLPVPSEVNLKVYNIQGELIRSISDRKTWSAGSHTVIWSGKNDVGKLVGSGVYYYQLKTSDYTKTRKMLLLK